MLFWNELLHNLGLRIPGKRVFAMDTDLVNLVEDLARQESRSSNDVLRDLLATALQQRNLAQDTWQRWLSLSPREQQVAALACLDFTNRQIAARLVVSVDTVHSHMRSALRKFDVHSKAELRRLLAGWDFTAWT